MPQCKFSKKFVATVQPPTDRSKIAYSDTGQPGLVLEVRKAGGKTYYFRYSTGQNRRTHVNLGDANAVDLQAARDAARERTNQLARGEDPRESRKQQEAAPTLQKFAQEQYLPYVRSYKFSYKTDEQLLRQHILPALGRERMDRIKTYAMTQLVHGKLDEGYAPASVNRITNIMRYMYNLAIRWEVPGVTANPVRNVDKFHEANKLERYLTVEEVHRLMDSLATSPNPDLQDIVLFLLLTGARRGEALSAEWKDFSFEHRVWTITKSKSRSPRYVHLSDRVIELLKSLRTYGAGGHVFVSRFTGRRYKRIYNQWNRARKLANLPNVRLHDLRHSFASFLINNRRSLYEVKALLGHHSISVTERYAHLQNDTLIAAANEAGEALAGLSPPSNTNGGPSEALARSADSASDAHPSENA